MRICTHSGTDCFWPEWSQLWSRTRTTTTTSKNVWLAYVFEVLNVSRTTLRISVRVWMFTRTDTSWISARFNYVFYSMRYYYAMPTIASQLRHYWQHYNFFSYFAHADFPVVRSVFWLSRPRTCGHKTINVSARVTALFPWAPRQYIIK